MQLNHRLILININTDNKLICQKPKLMGILKLKKELFSHCGVDQNALHSFWIYLIWAGGGG